MFDDKLTPTLVDDDSPAPPVTPSHAQAIETWCLIDGIRQQVVSHPAVTMLTRTPYNCTPVLVCTTCEEWRVHGYVERREVRVDFTPTAVVGYELIFACNRCTKRRRFGFEAP